MKLFRTFLALIFFTIFASPALAEEFDPIGDLYSNDALLNLDLSADFEMENSAFEESAIPVFELPPAETETLAAIPANDFEEIEIGSGGAIGDYSSEESPLIDLPTPRTDIPPIFLRMRKMTKYTKIIVNSKISYSVLCGVITYPPR